MYRQIQKIIHSSNLLYNTRSNPPRARCSLRSPAQSPNWIFPPPQPNLTNCIIIFHLDLDRRVKGTNNDVLNHSRTIPETILFVEFGVAFGLKVPKNPGSTVLQRSRSTCTIVSTVKADEWSDKPYADYSKNLLEWFILLYHTRSNPRRDIFGL